jgi:putative oxidoreductase
VEELDGEPAITSTAASAPKPVDVAAHGSQKLFGAFGGGGPAGTTKFFRSLGFRAPLLMALAAGLGELVGGLLFAVGLLTPLAALILTVVMLNAIGTVHWKKGFFNSAGGYEFNLVILATVVAITRRSDRVAIRSMAHSDGRRQSPAPGGSRSNRVRGTGRLRD